MLALLGRARGVAVTGVDASLALTATVFQSEDVAALAVTVPCPIGWERTCGDRRCGSICIEPRTGG